MLKRVQHRQHAQCSWFLVFFLAHSFCAQVACNLWWDWNAGCCDSRWTDHVCWFELLSTLFPECSLPSDSVFPSSPFYRNLFQQSLLTYFCSNFKLLKFSSFSTSFFEKFLWEVSWRTQSYRSPFVLLNILGAVLSGSPAAPQGVQLTCTFICLGNKLIHFMTSSAFSMPRELQPFTFLTCSQICVIAVSNWVCIFRLMRMSLLGMLHAWHMFIVMAENSLILKTWLLFLNWTFWQIWPMLNIILNEYFTIHRVALKPDYKSHMHINTFVMLFTLCLSIMKLQVCFSVISGAKYNPGKA